VVFILCLVTQYIIMSLSRDLKMGRRNLFLVLGSHKNKTVQLDFFSSEKKGGHSYSNVSRYVQTPCIVHCWFAKKTPPNYHSTIVPSYQDTFGTQVSKFGTKFSLYSLSNDYYSFRTVLLAIIRAVGNEKTI
jgi:hypothetical protein